jgi:bisphosphoglycerate-independent phosphoglycerate mutase (AlkP superfamily)
MGRHIHRNDIEYLFKNARFNIKQTEKIVEMVEILGRYMFLDRNLLERKSRNGIGLSYLEKATKHDIVVQMRDETRTKMNDTFYFQLGIGGKYLLQYMEENFHDLILSAGRREKSNILTFNIFADEKGYDISMKYKQDKTYIYFICENNIICYIPNYLTDKETAEKLINNQLKSLSFKEAYNNYNYIPIDINPVVIGSRTKNVIL